jgi:uncharacterized protein (DUF1778 family)
MSARTAQLQIRVTPGEKATLKRLALAASMDVSAYVLRRALPKAADSFAAIIAALRQGEDRRYALAAWDDALAALTPAEFGTALERVDLDGIDAVAQNYLAALVELVAHEKQVPPPAWTSQVAPLEEPHFATTLRKMRGYLLRVTAVPFKRRNVFTERGVARRV